MKFSGLLLVSLNLFTPQGLMASSELPNLIALVRSNNLPNIEKALEAHPKELVNSSNPLGTALHAAVRMNNREIVELLLAKGARVNEPASIDESTPLHLASKQQDTEILEVLLGHNADIETTDSKGRSPLFIAILNNNTNAAERLLDRGGSLEQTETVHGRTAIHYAVLQENLEMLKWLVAQGSDLTSVDTHGSGLMEKTVHEPSTRTRNSVDLIRFLFEQGLTDLVPAYEMVKQCANGAYPREILSEIDWLMPLSLAEGEPYKPLISFKLETQ